MPLTCKATRLGSACGRMAQTTLRPTVCCQHMTMLLPPLLLPAAGLRHSIAGVQVEPHAEDRRQRIFGISGMCTAQHPGTLTLHGPIRELSSAFTGYSGRPGINTFLTTPNPTQ